MSEQLTLTRNQTVLPGLELEAECGLSPVCGIDEVGRGPLAGPVVAAAVILDTEQLPQGLNDSKKLTAKTRDRLFDEIMTSACVSVAEASVEEIDRLNILQASLLAMARAHDALSTAPRFALIDGIHAPKIKCPTACVKGGDGKSLSIAAASIIAKVTRDRLMETLAAEHPGYGWERNKGYPAPAHVEALKRFGPTPHHRRSFGPVRAVLQDCHPRA